MRKDRFCFRLLLLSWRERGATILKKDSSPPLAGASSCLKGRAAPQIR